MSNYNTRNSSEYERAEKFLQLMRKLVVKATTQRPKDSTEAINRIKRYLKRFNPDGFKPGGFKSDPLKPDGFKSGKVMGPLSFFPFCNTISQKSSVTMGEISNELSVSPATATRVVDWWVENGLVERLPDSSDKRLVRVTITEVGKGVHEIVKEIAHKRIDEFLGRLNPEEQIIMNLLLEKLLSAHENDADEYQKAGEEADSSIIT